MYTQGYRNIQLIPAYGRDYTSKAKVMADWNAGLDFLIQDYRMGGYVNNAQITQLANEGVTHLHFRYRKLTQVHVVKL